MMGDPVTASGHGAAAAESPQAIHKLPVSFAGVFFCPFLSRLGKILSCASLGKYFSGKGGGRRKPAAGSVRDGDTWKPFLCQLEAGRLLRVLGQGGRLGSARIRSGVRTGSVPKRLALPPRIHGAMCRGSHGCRLPVAALGVPWLLHIPAQTHPALQACSSTSSVPLP